MAVLLFLHPSLSGALCQFQSLPPSSRCRACRVDLPSRVVDSGRCCHYTQATRVLNSFQGDPGRCNVTKGNTTSTDEFARCH